MKRNIGNVERIIRVAGGIGITSLAFWGPQTPLAWIGLVPLVTGFVGWCPLYRLLGISTCHGESCSVKQA